MLRRNWLPALLTAVLVTVGTGCGDECIDSFDCRNDNGQPDPGREWTCNDGTCQQRDIPEPPPREDAGTDAGTDAGVACTDTAAGNGQDQGCTAATPVCDTTGGAAQCVGCISNDQCTLTQVCNPTTKVCEAGSVTTTPAETSTQIQAFVSAANGDQATPLAITGAFVTYIKPQVQGQTATELAGFFLQAEATGPAMFVSAAADPQVVVGDRVSLNVTTKTTTNGLQHASAITGLTRLSQGHPVQNLNTASPAGLKRDITGANDLETAANYESKLVSLSGGVADAGTGSGGGFTAFPITTTGEPDVQANVRLRVPNTVVSEVDLVQGCSFTLRTGPVWRFNAQTQPSVFAASELALSNCPAPKLASARAMSATSVRLTFDRRIAPASVQAEDFTINNSLAVSAATVDAYQVMLTTGEQTTGTAYTVTVSGEVTDLSGTRVIAPNNTTNFTGYTAPPPPAPIVINEVDYDMPGSGDSAEFVEIYNRSSGEVSLSTVFLVLVNGGGASPASYQKIDLTEVGSLAAGEYLVVGPATVVGPLAGRAGVKTLQRGTTDFIQNGPPDAVALYNGTTDALIDSLSYEGNVAQGAIAGTTTRFDFREGTEDTTNLSDNGAAGSLCRNPQSEDLNSNADDFRFTTTLTPGAVNVITAQ